MRRRRKRRRKETPSRKGVSGTGGVGRKHLLSEGAPSLIHFAHQVVQLRIFAEERFVFSLLLVHEVLNVHVKAGRRDAFGALRGLLAFLKQQRQEGEQRVSEERRGHQHTSELDRMVCFRRISILIVVWPPQKYIYIYNISSNTATLLPSGLLLEVMGPPEAETA